MKIWKHLRNFSNDVNVIQSGVFLSCLSSRCVRLHFGNKLSRNALPTKQRRQLLLWPIIARPESSMEIVPYGAWETRVGDARGRIEFPVISLKVVCTGKVNICRKKTTAELFKNTNWKSTTLLVSSGIKPFRDFIISLLRIRDSFVILDKNVLNDNGKAYGTSLHFFIAGNLIKPSVYFPLKFIV